MLYILILIYIFFYLNKLAYVHCFGSGGAWGELEAPKNPHKHSRRADKQRNEIGVYFDGYDDQEDDESVAHEKNKKNSGKNVEGIFDEHGKIMNKNTQLNEDGYDEYADDDEEDEENRIQHMLSSIDVSTLETNETAAAIYASAQAKIELKQQELQEKELASDMEILDQKRNGYAQFKQISVGEDFSCGITLETPSNLLCWGKYGKHDDMPRNITGPIRQVSVNKRGVCVIYGETSTTNKNNIISGRLEGKIQCWGHIASIIGKVALGPEFMNQYVSIDGSNSDGMNNNNIQSQYRSNEDKATKWVQIRLGHGNSVCAVNELSELHCWGNNHMPVPSDIVIV